MNRRIPMSKRDRIIAIRRDTEAPAADPIVLSRREEDVLAMVRDNRILMRDDADRDALRTLTEKRLVGTVWSKWYLTLDGAAIAQMMSAT